MSRLIGKKENLNNLNAITSIFSKKRIKRYQRTQHLTIKPMMVINRRFYLKNKPLQINNQLSIKRVVNPHIKSFNKWLKRLNRSMNNPFMNLIMSKENYFLLKVSKIKARRL